MKRRDFILAGSGLAIAGATAAKAGGHKKVEAPMINKGLLQWRMVTTWPKNFPGLGTGANLLGDLITKGSGGRLTVKVFGAKEVVPAFEAMDAVSNGTVQMGHGAPYYWKGKVAAAQFLASVPFGMTAQEVNSWYQWGNGQKLGDKIYKEMGAKFFPSGNTGVQAGGWFNKEMNSLSDYKGLKMRIPGLGGEVVKAAGGNVINLPGGEIPPALQSGALDATEWVGPYNDLAFGLYKSAKYYYFPGWHEPATVLDNFINIKAWEKLPNDLKAVVQAANTAVNQMVLSEFVARNNGALSTLVNKHKVKLRNFPDEVLQGLGKLANQVMNDIASKDPLSRAVMDDYMAFRKTASAWSSRSEGAYLPARAKVLG
ncbi:MAG: TRAP transporter substrate-binding protein [Rhodospirillaceae bacterium]|jgi:TRAP-type mannitol/chloroaromatic compound transport system substrate-binding protein